MKKLILLSSLFAASLSFALSEKYNQIHRIVTANYGERDGCIFDSGRGSRASDWVNYCFSFQSSGYRWADSAYIAKEALAKIGVQSSLMPLGNAIILSIHQSQYED